MLAASSLTQVHVLENNEGLLQRDYATNAPFYERFGIKSGTMMSKAADVGDPDVQVTSDAS